MGNASPGLPSLRMPAQAAPPLIFHQYIAISLYKYYFIGPFKKGAHKNV